MGAKIITERRVYATSSKMQTTEKEKQSTEV